MRAAAIGVALAGLGIATYLTVVHYAGGDAGVRDRPRLRDRAAVATTPSWRACRSRVLGLAGYLASSPRSPATARAGGPRPPSCRSPGLGFSGWLTYVEVGVLDAICIWCVGSAVCMALLDRADRRADARAARGVPLVHPTQSIAARPRPVGRA